MLRIYYQVPGITKLFSSGVVGVDAAATVVVVVEVARAHFGPPWGLIAPQSEEGTSMYGKPREEHA